MGFSLPRNSRKYFCPPCSYGHVKCRKLHLIPHLSHSSNTVIIPHAEVGYGGTGSAAVELADTRSILARARRRGSAYTLEFDVDEATQQRVPRACGESTSKT